MKLISSNDALTFLSHAAPRPWVQRLLRWMAFDEGLTAYSRKGRVRAFGSVSDMTIHLMEKAGKLSGPEMDAAIREEYSEETAAKLVGKDPYGRFEDETFEWSEADDPKAIDIGFFLFANELDWDIGVLKADYIPADGEMRDIFFADSEFLNSELERPEFDAEFEGLSFEFSRIEMLLPSMPLFESSAFNAVQSERRRPLGRPPKWDWEGAMAFVVSQAHHPDGLPTGPGAQARIEGLIADWFVSELQDAPSLSQIRQRAAKIMQMLERPKTPEY